jgi:rhodanese-related sulfurtransferase
MCGWWTGWSRDVWIIGKGNRERVVPLPKSFSLDMAVHIPWMEAPAWQVDPTFVEKVRNALHERNEEPIEQTLITAICRSGTRSRLVAEELARHGFSHVFNIAEGFEGSLNANKHRNTVGGWRYRGLPWEQS